MLFVDFFYTLKKYGVPITTQYILELQEALDKGLAEDVNDLYNLLRLICVKRLEHMDGFECAFSEYFFGIEMPRAGEYTDLFTLLESKPFKEWLDRQIKEGKLNFGDVRWRIPPQELFQKFLKTLAEQNEAHHGGNKWIGTEGRSPYGHSGKSRGGLRIGPSTRKSALKTIGERRYINYSDTAKIRAENLRQALETFKNMVPAGPKTDLDLDETVHRTAKNAGEIEFIFKPELRDKIKVILLVDNGGYSMDPFAALVSLVFSKIKDRFKDLSTYYYRNCIYGNLFSNMTRTEKYPTEMLLKQDPDTRVLIIGDASMAPEELFYPQGSIEYGVNDEEPGEVWLKRISSRFKYSVWLNPISKSYWAEAYGNETISAIGKIFHMEDLTLNGLKKAVDYINKQKA
ncbi:MAG: hypothetical protein SVM80_00595 [Halobacteriota archaeon]|nr:hypothetical protein [Halobacteriota archaeon]